MTTRAEDNPFPSVLFAEHVDPSNPGAGTQRLFVDTDHILKLINSSGTVTTFSGGFANPMTTAEDIIYGGASGAPTRKAKGSDGTFLGVASGALLYTAVTDALLSTSDITTNNASTSKHGFLKKLSNSATDYMDGTGNWSTPAGGGTALQANSVLDSSGDHAITGTTFADVDTTHCGFSITTGAHRLLCGWSGSVFPDGTRRVFLDIAVDGTRIANTTEGAFVSATTANFFSGSITLMTASALSAASHTVRLQARQSAGGGSGTIAGGSGGSPVGFLWAVELAV